MLMRLGIAEWLVTKNVTIMRAFFTSVGRLVGLLSAGESTEPYGYTEQDEFLNSVMKIRTILPPHELLDRLHELEQEANRVRVIHWGPRTLDLDILLYDDLILDDEELHIPHIEMHKRDFVLIPLAQIAPWVRHPVYNQTVQELLERLK